MSMGNHWKFSGGKIEAGEDYKKATEREIREELNYTIEFNNVFNENIYEYNSFIVQLISTKCSLVSGIPAASEHSKIIRLKRENLKPLVCAPEDLAAVDQLTKEEA